MEDPMAVPEAGAVGVETGISHKDAPATQVYEHAAEIMQEKLSSGEISPEEYEHMMKVNEAMLQMEEEETFWVRSVETLLSNRESAREH